MRLYLDLIYKGDTIWYTCIVLLYNKEIIINYYYY